MLAHPLLMTDPGQPLRLKREGFALRLANGEGPSAAFSGAGYSFKSREHLSKNAATQAAKPDLIARVAWLQERPRLAADLLQQWLAEQNATEAAERASGLRKAIAARATARKEQALPQAPEAPVQTEDFRSITDLLVFTQSEARAIYEKVSADRSDPYVIKSSLAAHRDYTVALDTMRQAARQADSVPIATAPTHAPDIMQNIRAYLSLPRQTADVLDAPLFKSVHDKDLDADIENLRYNVSQTLLQYDFLCSKNAVNQRDRLALLQVLNASLTRLAKMLVAKSEVERVERPAVGGGTIQTDPVLVLQFFDDVGLTNYFDSLARAAAQDATAH
ncbi:MAG: hypothetical protein ACK4VZ_10625 [Paracoccaceae bacterium]